jgi:hypothetical protein
MPAGVVVIRLVSSLVGTAMTLVICAAASPPVAAAPLALSKAGQMVHLDCFIAPDK